MSESSEKEKALLQILLRYAELAMKANQEGEDSDQHPSHQRANALAEMNMIKIRLSLSHEQIMLEVGRILELNGNGKPT